jgi:hypothetical protein
MKTTPSDTHATPRASGDVQPLSQHWLRAPEFLALAELRRRMVGGALPSTAPRTPEESARHAVFWVLIELEHLIRRFAKRLQAGESVWLRSGIYWSEDGRVDFTLRIVDHVERGGGVR